MLTFNSGCRFLWLPHMPLEWPRDKCFLIEMSKQNKLFAQVWSIRADTEWHSRSLICVRSLLLLNCSPRQLTQISISGRLEYAPNINYALQWVDLVHCCWNNAPYCVKCQHHYGPVTVCLDREREREWYGYRAVFLLPEHRGKCTKRARARQRGNKGEDKCNGGYRKSLRQADNSIDHLF